MKCPPHHWVIDTPNGPKSDGRCKKCKKKRAGFLNATDDYQISWGPVNLGDSPPPRRLER